MEIFDMNDRFKPLEDHEYKDYPNYTYDRSFNPFSADELADDKVVNEYIKKNLGRDRYSRLKPFEFVTRSNGIAMLTPPSSNIGYLTFKDSRYWKFVSDLYNELYKVVDEDNRKYLTYLKLNHCSYYYVVPQMVKSAKHIVDKNFYHNETLAAAREVYTELFDKAFSIPKEEVKVKAKKRTSLGYPFETPDGKPIFRDEEVINFKFESNSDDKKDFYSKLRFFIDRSDIKKQWMKHPRGTKYILRKQLEYASKNKSPKREDLPYLIENNMISVHQPSARTNAPDACVEVTSSFDLNNPMSYGKDRPYNVVTPNGVESGYIDAKKENEIKRRTTKIPGYTNRGRIILPSNNTMHVAGTILATALLHEVEKGPKGHPADREEVIGDHEDFAKKFSYEYDLYVQGIDCSNCEVTITSNSEIFMQLWPDWIRPYVSLTLTSVIPFKDFFHVVRDALCSAVWATTLYNILKGNFECARILYHNINKYVKKIEMTEPDFVKGYLRCLFFGNRGEYFTVNDWLVINPKLGTDDVLVQFAIKKGLKPYQFDKEMGSSTNMNCDPSFKDVYMFGMHITPYKMEVNNANKISKLFTSEHMGFSLRDGVATFERLMACGYTDVVDSVLKNHFGYGVSDYSIYVPAFKLWLKKHGIDVEEVFDFYNSTNKQLFEKYKLENDTEINLDNIVYSKEEIEKLVNPTGEGFELLYGKHVGEDPFHSDSSYDLEDITDILTIFEKFRDMMCAR